MILQKRSLDGAPFIELRNPTRRYIRRPSRRPAIRYSPRRRLWPLSKKVPVDDDRQIRRESVPRPPPSSVPRRDLSPRKPYTHPYAPRLGDVGKKEFDNLTNSSCPPLKHCRISLSKRVFPTPLQRRFILIFHTFRRPRARTIRQMSERGLIEIVGRGASKRFRRVV